MSTFAVDVDVADEYLGWRIRRFDSLNWVVERFEPGGAAGRGALIGKVSKPRWLLQGYYPALKPAALALLDKAAGHGLLTSQAKDVLEAVQRAEREVCRVLAALEAKLAVEVVA